jgi:tetratricopeptide (TPR) repeat protein
VYQSCETISAQLEKDINTLNTTSRDMPARHRSLSAVFNHSWSLLSQEERRVLISLAVFRGGFDLTAAKHISDANTQSLASLVDKSLIQVISQTRYSMHGIIQKFADERLGLGAQVETEVRKRHAEYFGDYVNLHAEGLRGPEHTLAFEGFQADIDNIRSAWAWAVEHRDVSILARACSGLHQLYEMRSWYQDGVEIFRQAVEAVSSDPEDVGEGPSDLMVLTARLQMYQGWFHYRLGREPEALLFLESCVKTLRVSKAHESLAGALLMLGLMSAGDMEVRKAYYQEGLEISRTAKNSSKTIELLNAIGVVNRLEGDFERSSQALSEGLELCQRHGDRWGESKILNNLGFLAREMGNYQEAREYHQMSLVIKQAFHDRAGEAVCFSNLGLTALRLGDLEGANTFFQESVAIYKDIGNIPAMTFGLDNLGKVAFEGGDLKKAKKLHQEVIRIAEEHRIDIIYSRYAFINLGVVLREMDENRQAWDAFRTALKLAWDGNYIPQVLEILTHVSELVSNEQSDLAVELLQVVNAHPRTTVQVLDDATRLLQVLGGDATKEIQPQSLEEIINRTFESMDEMWS